MYVCVSVTVCARVCACGYLYVGVRKCVTLCYLHTLTPGPSLSAAGLVVNTFSKVYYVSAYMTAEIKEETNHGIKILSFHLKIMALNLHGKSNRTALESFLHPKPLSFLVKVIKFRPPQLL